MTYFEPEVQGTSNGYVINRIRSTNLTGTIRNEAAMNLVASSISSTICTVVVSGLSGSVNIVGTLALQTGVGTAFGGGNQRRVLMVEDIGAA